MKNVRAGREDPKRCGIVWARCAAIVSAGKDAWRFLVLLSLFVVAASPGQAQTIPFPPAPASAGVANAAFPARAEAVITFNACGREDDYARIRAAMAGGNFDDQGENLTTSLIAKAAWVRTHAPEQTCSGTRFRAPDRNADGSFKTTLAEFAVQDRQARANQPSACATEVRETIGTAGITIDVAVGAPCMIRQINEAIMAMRKVSQLGSDKLVCIEASRTNIPGDFDVVVRELVRLLYFAGPNGRAPGLLSADTIDHMYRSLLAARNGPGEDSYSVLAGCNEPAGDALGTPEETADRHDFGNQVVKSIGDAFDWLTSFVIRTTGSALSSAGGLAAAPFLLMAGIDPTQIVLPHADIRVPETENHRLMIETSRYLTNADIIARLTLEGYDNIRGIEDDQEKVRNWLLQRLQDIAAHDFREYNARPYTRYSLNAVLNLHDFAAVHGDQDMRTAARIVLDLSEAKFAATANRGRRVVPFRRLSDNDGDDTFGDPGPTADLYNTASGADHQLARAMMLAGQTQLLPNGLPTVSLGDLVNAATSPYRLPPPVLQTAIERRSFAQMIRHAGVEQVFQTPAFTITAGGVRTPPTGSTLGQSRGVDRGVAMPTAIIATLAGNRMADLFRFNGVGRQDQRSANMCAAAGFACGIQPVLSAAFRNCLNGSSLPGDSRFFYSSAVCFPGEGPHFYLAARITDCPDSFCQKGRQWGVMEIVEAAPPAAGADGQPAPDPTYEKFRAERRDALDAIAPDDRGQATYLTADGRRIEFSLQEDYPEVTAINGTKPPPWLTAGGGLDMDGTGRATLKGTRDTVTIDFSDWAHPRRSP